MSMQPRSKVICLFRFKIVLATEDTEFTEKSLIQDLNSLCSLCPLWQELKNNILDLSVA
jgi:hypothetical protein